MSLHTQSTNWRGGYVTSTYGGQRGEAHSATSHGENLGTYSTLRAARAAITKAHRAWVAERNREHYSYMRATFG